MPTANTAKNSANSEPVHTKLGLLAVRCHARSSSEAKSVSVTKGDTSQRVAASIIAGEGQEKGDVETN